MSGSPAALAVWADALRAAALLAADPVGLGGAVLTAGHGPARERWLAALRQALPAAAPMRKLPLHAGDDRLLGGLDLAATLASGRPVAQPGLLAETDGGVLVVAMAERLPDAGAARRDAGGRVAWAAGEGCPGRRAGAFRRAGVSMLSLSAEN